MTNTLHIYAQEYWHTDALVFGTEEGLRALRDAIDAALRNGEGHTTSFCTDGEGYGVSMYLCDESELDALPLPYTDDVAADKDHARWKVLVKRVAKSRRGDNEE